MADAVFPATTVSAAVTALGNTAKKKPAKTTGALADIGKFHFFYNFCRNAKR
jgi:hypothetical protein